jgi:hypothetical protein
MWQLRTYKNSELYVPETDLVVQFQAIPMRLELLKTVFAHLANTVETNGREVEATKTPWSELVEGRYGESVTGQLRIGLPVDPPSDSEQALGFLPCKA